ncbi:hypothetical protein, partial [Janthinobacterium violaceinigrum]
MSEETVPAPAPAPASPPDFDPHRFSAEPKRKPNKTVIVIIGVFVVLMVLIGASVYLAKQHLSDFMAERAERKKEEQEMKKAGEDTSRKGKLFAASSASSSSADGALPARFGKADEKKEGAESALPIPLLRNGSAAAAPPPAPPAAPPPPPPPPPPSL